MVPRDQKIPNSFVDAVFIRKKMGWIYLILAPPLVEVNGKPQTKDCFWNRDACCWPLLRKIRMPWRNGWHQLRWLGLVGVFFFVFSSWLGWGGLVGFGKHPSIFSTHVVYFLFFHVKERLFLKQTRGPDFLSLSLKPCGVYSVCLQIRKNAGISSQRVARVGRKSGPLEASRKIARTAKSVDLDEFLVEQWSNEVANNDGKRDMSALQGFFR